MTGTKRLSQALALLLLTFAAGCWIPLPEETAIVVEIYDSEGRPVNDVGVNVDGVIYISGQNLGNEGRVFRSLTQAGNHSVSVDPSSFVDPQGGVRLVPLASLVSGEARPLSYMARPFAGGDDAIIVPVEKGFISVVTIYLADMLQAPLDNQWLTDGNLASNWRPENGSAEFSAQPQPTFWWRMDPSLAGTVVTTFQLWQDMDGDIRYPLGVKDPVGYNQAMDPNRTTHIQPHWQIPNAGLQRAEGLSGGRVRLYSGSASGADRYDVYYAPTATWKPVWENNSTLRDVTLGSSPSPDLVLVELGPGTPNSGIFLRNGKDYTFALRARDAASNLDTLLLVNARSMRTSVPQASANLGAVSSVSVWDTDNGGQLTLAFQCSASQSLRVYAAPVMDWLIWPFDPRFVRDTTVCTSGGNYYTLGGLVSRAAVDKMPVNYIVGLEPFDAFNNVGVAATVIGSPTSGASLDTVQPFWANGGTIVATAEIPAGDVRVTFDFVDDPTEPSAFFRRLYHGPVSLAASNNEGRAHTDIYSNAVTDLTFSDIPNGVQWYFAIQALDAYGNASTVMTTQITLNDPLHGTGPEWATDTRSLFFSVGYPLSGTVTHPLGAAYDYHGFPLATSGAGEYVWRVVQKGSRSPEVGSKLGSFYTWSGFYYATTVSGGLNMGSPSTEVQQRDVFNFVEQSLSRASVMGAQFDSNASNAPYGYRQRTVQGFAAMLEGGSNRANQLVLRYVTDEDGVVTDVGLDTNGNGQVDAYGALLEVTAVNSQYVDRALSSYPPHLQRKTLLTLYREDLDEMFFFPGSALGVSFNGSLATPDALDPKW